MRIALASDHAGFAEKERLKPLLSDLGIEFEDLGTTSEESVDYPDYAARVARAVADGSAQQGLLVCGSGTGMAMTANKVPGVRAALCTDAYTADGARRWNDANVLALSLRLTSEPLLKEILDAWFAASASEDAEDRANVERVGRLDLGRSTH